MWRYWSCPTVRPPVCSVRVRSSKTKGVKSRKTKIGVYVPQAGVKSPARGAASQSTGGRTGAAMQKKLSIEIKK